MKAKKNFLTASILMCVLSSGVYSSVFAADITTEYPSEGEYDSINRVVDNTSNEGVIIVSGGNYKINNGGSIVVNKTATSAYGINVDSSVLIPTNVNIGGTLNIKVENNYTGKNDIAMGIKSSGNPSTSGKLPTVTVNNTNAEVKGTYNAYGLLGGSDFGNNSSATGTVVSNGNLKLDVSTSKKVTSLDNTYTNRTIGLLACEKGIIELNGAKNIINVNAVAASGNDYAETAGLYLKNGTISSSTNSDIEINIRGSRVYGINAGYYDIIDLMAHKKSISNLDLRGTTQINLFGNISTGVTAYCNSKINIKNLSVDFDKNVNSSIGIVSADGANINIGSLAIGTGENSINDPRKIVALKNQIKWSNLHNFDKKGGSINVNEDGSGTVKINGKVIAQYKGDININLNDRASFLCGNTYVEDNAELNLKLNNSAVWTNVQNTMDLSSKLTNLSLSNGGLIDMTDTKYTDINEHKWQKLIIDKTFDGTGGILHMDIDASTNQDNSDRVFVNGTHTGNHYITLNNVNADGNTDGAAGTVLVSVKDEQGKFLANDKESSLYWYKYTLDHRDSTTDGYNTDWYLKGVEIILAYPLNPANPRPTTSVDAVDATQRLAFANWVEDDKLMQRMGDLRHETNNEEGVWVRVKGGKYSGDGFSNRHTMYQLGYDDVVKENEKLKRYQGVAFAYDDGKNSFNRGSGKLKAKSIGFYNTDLRNKGHYLDVVFKIYDADSDFTVFDSEGKKITGAFDNTGISLSAEYGRKKYLDEHWSVEPQAQLTLGYLSGARYTTSNGIHVSQSDPNSVLGRIGCNFMYDMDEKNTVYLKANWLHQFAGNYGVTLTNGNDSLRIDNHDHDTWFEYGLGFACMTGKNNHLYADVERSTGGSLRKNWQWNAGMFWTF